MPVNSDLLSVLFYYFNVFLYFDLSILYTLCISYISYLYLSLYTFKYKSVSIYKCKGKFTLGDNALGPSVNQHHISGSC